jgi:hypothetical protein
MASSLSKIRALISIALLLTLALTFLSAGEGEDEGDGQGSLSILADVGSEDMHVMWAYLLVGLTLLHMLLNHKLILYEIKALLGMDKKSRAQRKG